MTRVLRDGADAVTGVEFLDRGARTTSEVRAGITVGADGRRSLVADAVGGAVRTPRGVVERVPLHLLVGLRPAARPLILPARCRRRGDPHQRRAGVPVGRAPSPRFHTELRGNLNVGYRRLLAEAAPELAGELASGRPEGPIRGFPGVPGHLRRAAGAGWALIGDAGYFKDPITRIAIRLTLSRRDGSNGWSRRAGRLSDRRSDAPAHAACRAQRQRPPGRAARLGCRRRLVGPGSGTARG